MAHKDCVEFVKRYWPVNDNLPKHEKLRKAITTAIVEGYWSPGARLPTELEWVSATPCGLATVQRTLRTLVDEGLIHRRRGSGTVVAHFSRPLGEGPWHMRFLRQDGSSSQHLPVSTRVLHRRVIKRVGPWSEVIEQGDHPVVKINRVMVIGDEFDVYNVFYARADLFPELANMSLGSLHGANIKRLIFQHYQMSVHSVRHRLKFAPVPERVAANCRWPAGELATVVNAVAYSREGGVMYYQDFYIPPNPLILELGTDSWL